MTRRVVCHPLAVLSGLGGNGDNWWVRDGRRLSMVLVGRNGEL